MKQMTVKDVLEVSGGTRLSGDENTPIHGMSFDSRTIKAGYLYVPLIGERVDGHQFIESAWEQGAAAVLTTQHNDVQSEKPYIRVKDAVKAMQDIAAFYRRELTLPVIGITGSVGKTTTRSMVAEALSAGRKVYQTQGNLNSQLGVPVMVMNIKGEEAAVLEMGISEFGEMERLSRIVCPDIAIITCIGIAHIQQLKTRENICEEKMAITNHMKPDGILLLNGDDEILKAHKCNRKQKVYFYGTGEDCEFRAKNIRIVEGKAEFEAVCIGETVSVTLSMPGMHNVQNAMAALAACKLCDVSLTEAVKKLAEFGGVKMRQQIYRTARYTILDDSYNANPDSMKAGLRVLQELPKKGRAIAVLGDMYELGEDEIHYHKEIGDFAIASGLDMLLTIGNLAFHMGSEKIDSKTTVLHFTSKGELTSYLKETLNPEDVVLLKASRGMALNEVTDALLEFAGTIPAANVR